LLATALCAAGPKLASHAIKSVGIIAALGDTCMFERVQNKPFEWIAPPEASFLEISGWGIDDDVTTAIAKRLGPRYRVQAITIEHQDFDTWTWESLSRRIRELPIPQSPVDAYLLVLRDWQHDEIGGTDHELGGLGLYRRDLQGGDRRLGVFASYRLLLADPDSGNIIASRPALLPDGALSWLPAAASLWPRNQNDLTEAQHRTLQSGFVKLIDESLPNTLNQLGLAH
jgi:hypothetical protein